MKKEYERPICEVINFAIRDDLMDLNIDNPSITEGEEDWPN